ncbi:hypothetical protein [Nocardioides sp. T2.26MG-1]|uniref:hypothetical protein n=1 Tax=Nocardioides sp. T2.26MG-1 TaxID=3041166 RepID=UPI0024774DBF|nr:hypothetical protein [Nocardioides sp. T2.26MG-1]CAI9400659.1 hypothetical protein HIDPHFAB_00448 [Nocardioides sp. T2.26MG-1]
MTEQTPSGNRWEPTDPQDQPVPPVSPAAPDPVEPPTAETPPPAPADPERRDRWRTLLRRPGPAAWLASGLSALVVFVGLGGFLLGRASVDDPAPSEVGQQWRQGPPQQGELPGRPFDDPDGDDGDGPGLAPGTES